jgi:hypothetical protein
MTNDNLSVSKFQIPRQLQKEGFGFVKLMPKSKKPFETAWQNNPYNLAKITEWIKSGNNYGVAGGYGNLIMIDQDRPEVRDIVETKLPLTFTVKSRESRRHSYYLCSEIKEKIVLQTAPGKENHYGEIISFGSQVVGPGSIHPETNTPYEVVNNIEIASVSREDVLSALADYLPVNTFGKKDYEVEGNNNLNVIEVLRKFGIPANYTGKQLQIPHPIHGSENGGNFVANAEKNCWYCFRCETGGGAISLVAVLEGIIDCSQAVAGGLRGENFKKTMKIAEEKYGLKPQSNIGQSRFYNSYEKQNKKSQAITICLANVKPEPISWLWPGLIPRGKITLIAGDPGLGKSLISSMLASVASKGYTWPLTDSHSPIGDVVLLSAEDDPADTIRPRLDAAGADCSRVHIIESIKETITDGSVTHRMFSFKQDITALDECLSSFPDCKLVIVDPVSAYMDGTDGNSNTDIRGLFAPLAALAMKYKVAVVLIQHLNKSGGTNALYRSIGSIAFVGAARSAFIVTKDPDNPKRRLFMPTKNNLAEESNGLAYSVIEAENGAPVIVWESDPITITANDALAVPEQNEERTATDEAVAFLRDLLSAGPMQVSKIEKESRQAGINSKPLRSARIRLGIKSVKSSFEGGWVWALPQDALNVQDAQPLSEGNLGDKGHLGQDKPKENNYPEKPNYCEICKKYWKNDPYCPHSFDADKSWRLKKRSGKINFSSDGKTSQFLDKKDDLIGEYSEPDENIKK